MQIARHWCLEIRRVKHIKTVPDRGLKNKAFLEMLLKPRESYHHNHTCV